MGWHHDTEALRKEKQVVDMLSDQNSWQPGCSFGEVSKSAGREIVLASTADPWSITKSMQTEIIYALLRGSSSRAA